MNKRGHGLKVCRRNVFGQNLFGLDLNISGPKNCGRNIFGHKSYRTKMCMDKNHVD